MPLGLHFVYFVYSVICFWWCLSNNIVDNNICERTLYRCNEYLQENFVLRACLTSLPCRPGWGQRGGAQAEVWEALQWGDRNPPQRRSQLHDCPWQGIGYYPPPARAFQPHVNPSSTEFTLFTDTFERCPLQSCFFYPLWSVNRGSPFSSHLALFFLPGSYIKRHQAPLSFSFYSHSYMFSCSLALFVEYWYF